ncbi:phosphoribosylaminoimidazole carboxylase [Fervidobacterium sp. SC_NGM5_G05]|nr:phosphoribosylaminoimidazole carboxylase [Fervidobacterium sp. SC_NGM5_G05]
MDTEKRTVYPFKIIGFIGGGQLGRMMAFEAKRIGFKVIALDPKPNCPISHLSDELIVADLYDEKALRNLIEKSDVVTYEIEHTNTEFLKKMYDEGYNIQPSPYILEVINDKLKQKQFLISNGIPTPSVLELDISKFSDTESILKALENNGIKFPFVQKSRRGGYDGRGVFLVKEKDDLSKIIKSDSYIEEYVEISKEISVLLARNKNGEIKLYEVVEMIFDEKANILDFLISPARIDKNIAQMAKDIAIKIVSTLKGVGVFAIEMFVTKDNDILVNEIAPRVHNSGHHTIEACFTNQFEQHIRAICNIPLGSTYQHTPSVMINLLGEEGYQGKPIVENLEEVFKIEGAYFHFYGKDSTFPKRKMGHITVLDENLEKAIEKARYLREKVKIVGDKKLEVVN